MGVSESCGGVVDVVDVWCMLCAIWQRGVVVKRDKVTGGTVGDGGVNVMVGRLVCDVGVRWGGWDVGERG